MSEVTINNSPVHSQSTISRVYGYVSSDYSCGWHTGVDFVPYGTTIANPPLFSPVNGEVVYINTTTTNALGVHCIIKETGQNRYWRLCHMVAGSLLVNVGDTVSTLTQVGTMGATGNVTGIHLHLECSTTQAWDCSTFLNPCTILGIPNEVGTIINYDGDAPPPTPPTPTKSKNNWKWFLCQQKNILFRR